MMHDEQAHFFSCFEALLAELNLRPSDAHGRITASRTKPHIASRHALGHYAGLSMLAAAHAAAGLHHARSGQGQDVHIDVDYAVLGLNPERLFGPTLNGRPYGGRGIVDNPYLRAPYPCRDGAYIMISGLYPAMVTGLNAFLGCDNTEADVARAVGQWQSGALEDALTALGFAAAICRTPEAWRQHPQGQTLSQMPVAGFRRVADAPKRHRAPGSRPLQGIRVLSLGRALAGPIVGRTLAEQGADVLGVGYPGYVEHEAVWCEANVGHRSCGLDFNSPKDRAVLEALVQSADVVINNHQSPRITAFGLDAASLIARHPGLVHVAISAFGDKGPWAQRAGFDMNASAATGIMVTEGGGGAPKLPVCHLAHDVVAGYLGAASVTAALRAQMQQGGSYVANLSLARCAMWCQALGNAGYVGDTAADHYAIDSSITPRLSAQTPMGTITRMGSCAALSQTPGQWRTPLLERSLSGRPEWLPI